MPGDAYWLRPLGWVGAGFEILGGRARARQSPIHIRCHSSRTRRSVPPTPAPSGPVACLAVKPAGKPDAGNRHVRFDERGWETGRWPEAQATAPILDSTFA